MDSLPINITDLAVIVIILLSGLLALTRGFMHEVLSIGSWVGGAFIGLWSFPYSRPYARDLIENNFIADIVAGAGGFIVSLIILNIISRFLSAQVQESALNPLDRSLGFVFGLLRGAIIVCLLYIAVEWMVPAAKQPDWLRDARTMPLVENGSQMLKTFIPEDEAAAVQKSADTTKKSVENAIELQKTYEKILTPTPKSDTSEPNADTGYDSKERQDLNRLFRNAQ